MSDHWGTPPQRPEPSSQPGQPSEPGQPSQPSQPGQPEILSNQPGFSPPPGTSPYAPPTGATHRFGDILGTPGPAPRAAGKGKLLAIGVGVVAVAGIGVGAAFAAGALGHDSSKPDKLVPATAVGYVSIDLDPGLGQKVDALRFLRKFPSAKASLGTTDDIRKWAFEQATKDDKLSKVSYDADVKPWIGDKFGLAVVPGAKAGSPPSVVVVIQVTDEGKAKAGLKKLITKPSKGTCSVASGYAVCAETQSILTTVQAAAAKQPLADDAHFKADVSSIGKRGIALGWGDLDKVTRLVPDASQALGGMAGGGLRSFGPLGQFGQFGAGGKAGRVVATLRFEGGNLELTGKTMGGKAQEGAGSGGTGVEQLPNKTVAAFGASIDDQAIAKAYASMQQQLKAVGGADALTQVQQELASRGFRLPQDLQALVGTKFEVAFGGLGSDGTPLVGVRSNADAAKAGKVLDKLSAQLSQAGLPFALRHVPAAKGYAVALDERYAAQLAAGGHLGDQVDFKAAVPDAAKAQVVVYVNVAQLLSGPTLGAFGTGPVSPNLKALGSVGLSATSGSDRSATFRLKVTTR